MVLGKSGSVDIDSDDIFMDQCTKAIIRACDGCDEQSVREGVEKLKSVMSASGETSALPDVCIPDSVIPFVTEMIRSRSCALRLFEEAARLRAKNADARKALSSNELKIAALTSNCELSTCQFDGWLSACSSWEGHARASIDALEKVADRPTLNFTSEKMDAVVKRAMVGEDGSLSGSIVSRIQGPDGAGCTNVHMVYFKRTDTRSEPDAISKLMYYVRVSRVLHRKCRLLALPPGESFSRFAKYALMYEEYDFSTMELVPFETPLSGRSSAWSTVAFKFFWQIAATFVRPGPNRGSTGSIFHLIGQLEDLHHARMVHSDLTRSTVKFDAVEEKFKICGLDRICKAADGEITFAENAQQCARVIKTILEYLIRIFFENMKTMRTNDEEIELATQWAGSLASWAILRAALHAAQKNYTGSLWKDPRHLRYWVHDQLERVGTQREWDYKRIRDTYARNALSYDRKR